MPLSVDKSCCEWSVSIRGDIVAGHGLFFACHSVFVIAVDLLVYFGDSVQVQRKDVLVLPKHGEPAIEEKVAGRKHSSRHGDVIEVVDCTATYFLSDADKLEIGLGVHGKGSIPSPLKQSSLQS